MKKKNILLLAIIFILFSISAESAFSQTGLKAVKSSLKQEEVQTAEVNLKASTIETASKASIKTGAITGQNVKLRQGPSTSDKVIFDVLYGTKCEVLEEKNGFARVKFDNGVTGWMSKTFITYTDKNLLEGPKYTPEALEKAASEFQKNYAAYTVNRNKANYDAFKKSYYTYRELVKNSDDYKAIQKNPAAGKIVVDKKTYTLTLYLNDKPVRVFPIAYGQNPDGRDKQKVGDCRTPDGSFKIINKEKRPYEGVATRWMQLSTKWGDIGIHGTPMPDSIGSKASHGCVRMYSQDSIELFQLVKVGTPVTIKGYSSEKIN